MSLSCTICEGRVVGRTFYHLTNCEHLFHELCLGRNLRSQRADSGEFEGARCPACFAVVHPDDVDDFSHAFRDLHVRVAVAPTRRDSHFRVVVQEIYWSDDDPVHEQVVVRGDVEVRHPRRILPRMTDAQAAERNETAERERLDRERRWDRRYAERFRRLRVPYPDREPRTGDEVEIQLVV